MSIMLAGPVTNKETEGGVGVTKASSELEVGLTPEPGLGWFPVAQDWAHAANNFCSLLCSEQKQGLVAKPGCPPTLRCGPFQSHQAPSSGFKRQISPKKSDVKTPRNNNHLGYIECLLHTEHLQLFDLVWEVEREACQLKVIWLKSIRLRLEPGSFRLWRPCL